MREDASYIDDIAICGRSSLVPFQAFSALQGFKTREFDRTPCALCHYCSSIVDGMARRSVDREVEEASGVK
jgi:hypothetical protein